MQRALLAILFLIASAVGASACSTGSTTVSGVLAEINNCITVQTAPNAITPTIHGAVETDIVNSLGSFAPTWSSALSRTFSARGMDRLNVTDFCSATQISTDISSCAQLAINAAATSNGSGGAKEVFFPAVPGGGYTLTGTLVLPTMVSLVGEGPQSTYITCANGSSVCIQIGNSAPGTATRDQRIAKLAIVGSGKTGGALIYVTNTYDVTLRDLELDAWVRGIEVADYNNTTAIENVFMTSNLSTVDYGIYFHASGSDTTSSCCLTLKNVFVTNNYHSASGIGFFWDGWAQTLNMENVTFLKANYCLKVTNATGTSSNFPEFLQGNNIVCEGAMTRGVDIEAGHEFHFVNSNLTNSSNNLPTPNSDDYAVAILADSGGSITRGVRIAASRIGNSAESGLFNNARDTQLSGVQFFSTSSKTANTYPVIDNGANSQNTILTNITCEEYGGLGQASYCLQNESGATDISAVNVDGRYTSSGVVNDLGSTRFIWSNMKNASGAEWNGVTPTNTGSCSVSSQSGGAVGKFTSGACSNGTYVLSMAPAASVGWTCGFHDITTPADAINQTASSTTSVTATGSAANADVIVYSCQRF